MWIIFVQCRARDSLQGDYNNFINCIFLFKKFATSLTPPLNFHFLYLGDLNSILNVSHKREKFRGVVFFVLGLGRIASRDKRIKDTY